MIHNHSLIVQVQSFNLCFPTQEAKGCPINMAIRFHFHPLLAVQCLHCQWSDHIKTSMCIPEKVECQQLAKQNDSFMWTEPGFNIMYCNKVENLTWEKEQIL